MDSWIRNGPAAIEAEGPYTGLQMASTRWENSNRMQHSIKLTFNDPRYMMMMICPQTKGCHRLMDPP